MKNRLHNGFTLVELMIAMVLGVLLAGGVLSLFVSGVQSFRLDENVARMQDEARFAISELSRDLRMAGYLAEPLIPAAITPVGGLAAGVDCGNGQANWILSLTDAVTGETNTLTSVDNATGAAANAAYSCINAGEIVGDTDVVGIKRLAGDAVPVASLQANTIYVRSNGSQGVFYQAPLGIPFPLPLNDWEYRPQIYYIRNFTNVGGDGIPSLCRKVMTFGAPTGMTTECIAQGIEDLQIEYGLDTDGSGSANRYLPNPTLTELQQVVSARVFILARTLDADQSYKDNRTYSLSNANAYKPNDAFHRRLYTVTVPINNIRNRVKLGI